MTANSPKQSNWKFVSTLTLLATLVLSACQTIANNDRDTRPGTFLNPPKLGAIITPRVGSVVCLNELDALGMVRTGFFTQSCRTLTSEMVLVAESIERVDAGEGMVIMIKTTFEGAPAWVPIPWHDWV